MAQISTLPEPLRSLQKAMCWPVASYAAHASNPGSSGALPVRCRQVAPSSCQDWCFRAELGRTRAGRPDPGTSPQQVRRWSQGGPERVTNKIRMSFMSPWRLLENMDGVERSGPGTVLVDVKAVLRGGAIPCGSCWAVRGLRPSLGPAAALLSQGTRCRRPKSCYLSAVLCPGASCPSAGSGRLHVDRDSMGDLWQAAPVPDGRAPSGSLSTGVSPLQVFECILGLFAGGRW